MKRALRIFGSRLGNCAYDKAYLRGLKSRTNIPPPAQSTMAQPTHSSRPTVSVASVDKSVKLSSDNVPSGYSPQWINPRAGNVLAPKVTSESDPVILKSEDTSHVFSEERNKNFFKISMYLELLEFDSFMVDGESTPKPLKPEIPLQNQIPQQRPRPHNHHCIWLILL